MLNKKSTSIIKKKIYLLSRQSAHNMIGYSNSFAAVAAVAVAVAALSESAFADDHCIFNGVDYGVFTNNTHDYEAVSLVLSRVFHYIFFFSSAGSVDAARVYSYALPARDGVHDVATCMLRAFSGPSPQHHQLKSVNNCTISHLRYKGMWISLFSFLQSFALQFCLYPLTFASSVRQRDVRSEMVCCISIYLVCERERNHT